MLVVIEPRCPLLREVADGLVRIGPLALGEMHKSDIEAPATNVVVGKLIAISIGEIRHELADAPPRDENRAWSFENATLEP